MTEELNEEEIVQRAITQCTDLIAKSPKTAEVILKQLLRCVPNHPEGLHLLGLTKHQLDENVEAVEIIKKAIELQPDRADNYNNIGLAYASLHKYDKAIAHLEKAVELNPNPYLFLNNLALQYKNVGNYDKAVETFSRALAANPEHTTQIWGNLGGVYGEMKQYDKAWKCFDEALRLNPNYPACHVDMAYLHHLQGDLTEGFKEYEWRFDYFPQLGYYKHKYDQTRRWNGKDDLRGKRIILYGEQGLGDTIQFCRYIKKLKELGPHIILHCPIELDSLMRRVEGVDETINHDLVKEVITRTPVPLPEYDYQCSLLSLPHLLGWQTNGGPYLTPEKVMEIKIPYPDTLNIGICWAGNAAHPNDALRSLMLKQFKPLYDIPNVKLFSLQMDLRKRTYYGGKRDVDLAEAVDNMKLVDMREEIKDFSDSAAIVSGLDLVISCDTALIHLCGALGVPCWALIPYNPDWRWRSEGTQTIWYQSVKLFRQKVRGDWDSVIQEVREALSDLLPN